MAWIAGYSYRMSYALPVPSVDQGVTAVPVRISSATIGARALSNLDDIRFALDDGTLLPYVWEGSHVVSDGVATATAWVRVPNCYAAGTSIWVYYGKADASAYASTSLSITGLKAWLPFGEGSGASAADASDNSNGVSFAGSPSWDAGKTGSAIVLDGSNDVGTIADSSTLHLSTGFTLSMWIYRTGTLPRTDSWIAKDGANTSGRREWFFLTFSDGYTYLACTNNSLGSLTYAGRKSSTAITGNTWHHLCGTWSGSTSSSGFCIYLDGARIDSANHESGAYPGMANTSEAITLGKVFLDAAYAAGRMDDVRIYSQELSATAVEYLYTLGSTAGTWGSEVALVTAKPWLFLPRRRIIGGGLIGVA